MQGIDDSRCKEAIDAEEIPAARLQPAAQPPEGKQAGEEREDHAEQTGEKRGMKVDRCGCGGWQIMWRIMPDR